MWVLVVYGKIGLDTLSSIITEKFLPVLYLGKVGKVNEVYNRNFPQAFDPSQGKKNLQR